MYERRRVKSLRVDSGKVMGPSCFILELWRSHPRRLGTPVLYSCFIPEGKVCGRASSADEHIHAKLVAGREDKLDE